MDLYGRMCAGLEKLLRSGMYTYSTYVHMPRKLESESLIWLAYLNIVVVCVLR